MNAVIIDHYQPLPTYWSCARKVAYSSRKSIKDAISRLTKKIPGAPRLTYYKCACCGNWHLTKKRG